ncbi:MAG: helix-turn-helix transcriptional regulator, partial [Bacteroidota bacterium]
LLIVAILDGKAYSVNIIEEIGQRLNRQASLGAVQTVLKRLEKKRLLKSELGAATKARGGKRKRLYEITAGGRQMLEHTRSQRNALWNAIPSLSFNLN